MPPQAGSLLVVAHDLVERRLTFDAGERVAGRVATTCAVGRKIDRQTYSRAGIIDRIRIGAANQDIGTSTAAFAK